MAHEGGGPTRAKKQNMGEVEPEALPKEWHRPALRRLPIAATANVGEFNEGGGKGKGKSGTVPSS
jgi:hypothetical protein